MKADNAIGASLVCLKIDNGEIIKIILKKDEKYITLWAEGNLIKSNVTNHVRYDRVD